MMITEGSYRKKTDNGGLSKSFNAGNNRQWRTFQSNNAAFQAQEGRETIQDC
jgi:hypothetical protein